MDGALNKSLIFFNTLTLTQCLQNPAARVCIRLAGSLLPLQVEEGYDIYCLLLKQVLIQRNIQNFLDLISVPVLRFFDQSEELDLKVLITHLQQTQAHLQVLAGSAPCWPGKG